MRLKIVFIFSLIFSSFFSFGQEINYQHDITYAFIENKGQWDPAVLFKSKFDGGNLWIQNKKFVFHFQDFSGTHTAHGNTTLKQEDFDKLKNRQTVVHLNFKNSNNFRIFEKLNPSSNYYNYFIGNDPTKWASNVRGFNEAKIKNIYNGIDLKLIEDNSKLKYEFHVSPNTSPKAIQLEFVGQENIFIDKNGNLHIQTEIGEVIEEKPYTYQIINGKMKEIRCSFKVDKNVVSFELGEYDKTEILIIDPTLVFATYSGSVTDNFGMTATYAHNGEAYSGGIVFGNQYPTPDISAFEISSNFTVNQASYGITDVFISKYSSDGTQMLWTNFIGGGNNNQGTETVHSLIADKNDNLYLYGATSSTDFPIVNGFQTTHGGGTSNLNFGSNGVYHLNQGTDIYISKISADGYQLLGSTYIGGSQNDGVNYTNNSLLYEDLMTNYGDNSRGEIMLDSTGNCIIASCTRSTNFPVINAFQPNLSGQQDGVLFMLDKNLSNLIWSSYFGGTNNDMINSVKIDSTYHIVFAGGTSSNNLPQTIGTYQTIYNGGTTDGFVAKLSTDGLTLQKVSYIGTNNYDNVFFIEVDFDGNIYLLGQSFGGSFPVINAGYVNLNSNQFICKLDSAMTTIVSSTTFGNGNPAMLNISPSAFLVDRCGNIYASGWGQTFTAPALSGMPVTADAFQNTPPNGHDFYLLVLDKSFNSIKYGSYMGGSQADEHVDGGTSRFDINGVMYQSVCGGCGGHSDFPTTTNAWSNINLSIAGGHCNNILFKFDYSLIPNSNFSVNEMNGCLNQTFQFQNTSNSFDSYLWDFGDGDTTSLILNPTKNYDSAGVFNVKLFVTENECLLTDSTIITINISDTIIKATTPDIFQCLPSTQQLIANSNGTAETFIWSSTNLFNDTLNNSVSDSTLSLDLEPGYYTFYVKYDNQGGCFETDSVTIYFPENNYSINGEKNLCLNDTSTITVVNNNSLINYTYSWSNDSIIITDPNLSSIDINPKTPQYLAVELISDSGCVILDSVFINIGTLDTSLVKAFTSDTLVPVGQTITLTSLPNNEQYSWTPTSQVNSPTNQETKALVNKSTYFKVTVSDGICSATDSIYVKAYTYLCDDPSIFVPNAFSPNGDGNNDVLYVRGNMINKMIFRIYDRWGTLLFETTDRLQGWDGTYNGKKLDPDVYDYYLQATCIDNVESIVKGNVTLLK